METEVFYSMIERSKAAKSLSVGAQSYLFCGKDTDALLLLARYCVASENNGKFSSADVMVLPEGDKVLVSDIESITSTAAVTPLELGHKYYILKNAHTMNDSAANKLLKTLEEPPSKVKIVLLADDEYSVLPTVRSRCRVVNLPPPDKISFDEAADEAYAGSPNLQRAKQLSLCSLTRLTKAIKGGYDECEKLVFDILTGMKSSRDVAKYAQAVQKQKTDLSEVVLMFELVFADVLRLHSGTKLTLDYRAADIAKIAEFYGVDTLIRFAPLQKRAHKRLKFFGNSASIIDEFLFSLLEVRQKCQS